MRKITSYISRTVFGAIALTLLVFASLDFIFSFIDELNKIKGDYTATEAFYYMLLSMPRRLYSLIPFACLIGSLIGLGLLANTSELVVVRAAGVSVKRIVWIVLRPALIFIMLSMVIGEYVVPTTELMADNRRVLLRDNYVRTSRNMWQREGNEYLFVQAVMPGGVAYGLRRYQFDDQHHLLSASVSKQAVYQGGHWEEEEVRVSHITNDQITTETLPRRTWNTPLTPELLNILVREPEDMSLSSLRFYTRYLEEQSLNASDYALAFWQKMLRPLAIVSLVLIAISFIFGPLRSVTMGQRIFTGVVIGMGFQLLQKLIGPASLVFGFSPIIAVLLPILLCALIGGYLLSRAR